MQTRLFIGGEFVDAADGATLQSIDPHDGSVLAEVAEAKQEDVDRAVAAAGKAFPHWSRLAAAERGRLLLRLADAIEADAANLALLETCDTGHPLRDTLGLDVPGRPRRSATSAGWRTSFREPWSRSSRASWTTSCPRHSAWSGRSSRGTSR